MAASPFRRHIDTSYTPFEVFKELPRGFERVLECSRGGVGFWGDSLVDSNGVFNRDFNGGFTGDFNGGFKVGSKGGQGRGKND